MVAVLLYGAAVVAGWGIDNGGSLQRVVESLADGFAEAVDINYGRDDAVEATMQILVVAAYAVEHANFA